MNKTISSLALLSICWEKKENKQDFIELFVPFIVTLISKRQYKEVDINTICRDFLEEFGLSIPYHPMTTILTRVKKRGYIRRGYKSSIIPVREKVAEGDFSDIALDQERKYRVVINSFINFCMANKRIDVTESMADELFVSFLKTHDLDILFANFDKVTLLPDVNSTTSDKYLINSFVISAFESNREVFNFIVDISVGHIIANTILQKDLANFSGQLSANIYLDIGLLFSLLGVDGCEKKQAYIEFVHLLQLNNASVFIFRHTYDEFMGILEGSMHWIEKGMYDISKASRALLFFIDNGYTVTDIERFINKVPQHLESLHVVIVDTPDVNKDHLYQIDEKALTDLIVKVYKEKVPSFDENEKDRTVSLDVKSVSAVSKLRKGNKPLKIANAKYIFVTTNSTLAYACRQFEFQILGVDYFFIPTVLTDVFIGTIVWIHSPTTIVEINRKRLIANAYAALQPNRSVLRKFVDTAERMIKEGTISEDEVTSLKASRVARNMLQAEILGDPDRITDDTILDVLQEFKAKIVQDEIDKFEVERESFLQQGEEREAVLQDTRQNLLDKEKDLGQTTEELVKVTADKEKIEKNITKITNLIANFVGVFVYLISVIIIILASLYQFFPSVMGDNLVLKWFFTILGLALTVFSLITGFNLKGTRVYLKNKVLSKLNDKILSKHPNNQED